MSETGRYGVMICMHCGRETARTGFKQLYCKECAKDVKRLQKRENDRRRREAEKQEEPEELTEVYEPPKRKAQKKPVLTIAQVTALARAAGMSYGQYVSKTERR